MKTCLIVYSDYYKDVSKSLLSGAIKILESKNIKYDVYSVDGSFERRRKAASPIVAVSTATNAPKLILP